MTGTNSYERVLDVNAAFESTGSLNVGSGARIEATASFKCGN